MKKSQENLRALYYLAGILLLIVTAIGIFGWQDEIKGMWQGIKDLFEEETPIKDKQITEQTLNCDDISILDIRPIRPFFYAGGTSAVTYTYTSDIGCNTTITQEWYRSSKPDIGYYLEKPHIWNDTIQSDPQNNWASKPITDKETNANYSAKIILEHNKSEVANSTSFQVIRNEEVISSLNFDQIITTNEEIVKYAFNNVMYGKNKDEYSQAKELFYLTRNVIKKPKKADEIIDFESKNYSSLEVYQKKKGTSSEFSVFYIMLIRSIGIPAKLNYLERSNEIYYYVEVYTKETGWLLADIYSDSEFDSCFSYNSTFLAGKKYYHACLEENNTLEFVELNIPPYLLLVKSDMTAMVRNKVNKDIRYLKINYTLFKDDLPISTDRRHVEDDNLSKNELTLYNSQNLNLEPLTFDYVILKPDYWT